jgi:hypothetical protein
MHQEAVVAYLKVLFQPVLSGGPEEKHGKPSVRIPDSQTEIRNLDLPKTKQEY